ncbi:MAG: hypothetical protein KGH61_01565 [Candidatus Micrarchaeota archaeon]|nr:hypothetical protein [Candidatus Micrarchaeota archaeon]MDE1847619.1 hypothetical protein [Candidatus Micrarchaeota archaeon]MDE1863822.1 hypothetical protein [Candidatus Micrarchaeota archaeon]
MIELKTGQSQADREKAQPEEMSKQWGMFAQAIVGQRLTNPEGKDIMKFVMVSFPIPPGLEKKGEKLIRMAMQGEIAATLEGKTESFNNEGTLLAHLAASQSQVNDKALGIFGGLYNAALSAVRQFHPEQSDENIQYFYKFQNSLKSRLGVLLEDSKAILKISEYQNLSAWETKYGGAFRQEMIFEDGKLFTLDPNNKLMEVNASLANSGIDYGHADWLTYLLGYINAAYQSGAMSVLGYQIDSTMTVSSCGGSEKSAAFYDQSMEKARAESKIHERQEHIDQARRDYAQQEELKMIAYNYSLAQAMQLAASQAQNPSFTWDAKLSVSAPGEIHGTHACSVCGAMINDQKTCSCKSKSA